MRCLVRRVGGAEGHQIQTLPEWERKERAYGDRLRSREAERVGGEQKGKKKGGVFCFFFLKRGWGRRKGWEVEAG